MVIPGLMRLHLALTGALVVMLALVAAVAFGVSKGVEKERKRTDPIIAALRADLGSCRANIATLNATLDRQSAAVAALAQESAARVAQSQREASAARAVAESYRQNARAVLEIRRTGEACPAADALILRAAGR